ncbi:polysaccharide pyruvyl transferase family protein [Klebsiella quasipneumoniae]|uniref:polysaccharide pyruvyl transferase family protein n=1 Tax=Klebsiella quasipneumoniae TaxID=1463165 RepID=UPI000C7A86E6|nr:polysaccharide pyruvyl transferase family protein [Klebsiella quasipneumoniae]MBR7420036.1 polysaccharide pyruvyl transferase [Klebsiella quasipneumoniae]MDE4646264.1 polysaccharide pyruvyl transferase family protein [Klebsiella quasipneumoniae subsp. similipneumoniae]PLJ51292.1 polysaccharide pyruvyl transferase [Klebsiella quasipneumoniae]VGJ60158.1 General stress protein 30 [Klebsiella quasipneumoniae]HBR1484751.1 polysaccharide pyruvyl transferase family protein [Klebsiella quasipneumon
MHQNNLKNKLTEILPFIKDKNEVIFLDYPVYLNVGDLLIYHGTENFFKENNINIKLRRSNARYSVKEIKKYINPNTVILMQGGGNFGDLYPEFQKFRQDVVSSFPDTRIIILPQTAFFENEHELNKSVKSFGAHKDLIIFSRDTRSLSIFKKFTSQTFLMPDMAHSLWGTLPKSQKSKGTLYLIRNDKEINQVQRRLLEHKNGDDKYVDWEDILTTKDLLMRKLCRKLDGIGGVTNLSVLKNISNVIWYNYTYKMVQRYALYFTSHEKVVTSRMHGHIFSCLLSLPNDVIDNAYGKNSGYFKEWTYDIDGTKLLEE